MISSWKEFSILLMGLALSQVVKAGFETTLLLVLLLMIPYRWAVNTSSELLTELADGAFAWWADRRVEQQERVDAARSKAEQKRNGDPVPALRKTT